MKEEPTGQEAALKEGEILEALRIIDTQSRVLGSAASGLKKYLVVGRRIASLENRKAELEWQEADLEAQVEKQKAAFGALKEEYSNLTKELQLKHDELRAKLETQLSVERGSVRDKITAMKSEVAKWEDAAKEAEAKAKERTAQMESDVRELGQRHAERKAELDAAIQQKEAMLSKLEGDLKKWLQEHSLLRDARP